MFILLKLWFMVLCFRGVLSYFYCHQSQWICLRSTVRRNSGVRCVHSYTLSNIASSSEVVKKSKFISHAAPVASFEKAMEFLEKVKDTKANHNCWAYRSEMTSRCSDDGEPAGTAGRPILNILETEHIVDAIIIVTRHFGGIKLGAGGLVRAYGGAAKTVIAQTKKFLKVPTTTIKFQVPMDNVGAVYNLLEQLQSKEEHGSQYRKLDEEFVEQHTGEANKDAHDSMLFTVQVPADSVTSFQSNIGDICRGKELYIVNSDQIL